MYGLALRAAAFASAIACLGLAPANALTSTGVAVLSIGSNTVVNHPLVNRPLLGGNAIEYYISLKESGNYGAASGPCAHGFGTCADTGTGSQTLSMFLKFDGLSTTQASFLNIKFEDLDLIGANDPVGFYERLRIYDSNGNSLTPWITTLNQVLPSGTITGNSDTQQLLKLALGILTDTTLWLELKFKSISDFKGTNTPEYLIASIYSKDAPPCGPGGPACGPGEVPLPGAVWLMGSVLLGAGGFAKWRKRRERRA